EALDSAALGTNLGPEDWRRFKSNVYESDKCMPYLKMLYKIEKYLIDKKSISTLTTCTDMDVREAMLDLCSKSNTDSIKKKVSYARQAFFAIGRKHEFGDGSRIQEVSTAPVWAYTGCPVTTALQDTLIDRVSLGKESKQSLGGAANFPLMAWYNIEQLCRTCNLIEKYEQKSKHSKQQINQIQNSCGLGMLMLMLMHTGSRPGNINRLLHEHCYFKGLHKKVYWLTLAIIRSDTLAHLIRNDCIKDYVMNIHNGYKKKGPEGRDELRVWEKSTIPMAYNSLDLPLIYAIYMRLILTVDPSYIKWNSEKPKVFTKRPQTYSDIFGNQNKVLGIENLVLYSMRYGTTKDDNDNEVAEEITRKRMAHSMNSQTAANVYMKCNKKVKYDFGTTTTPSHTSKKPLLKNPLSENNKDNMAFQRSWLEKAFADKNMQKDFDESADLVSEYLDEPSDSSYEKLESRMSARSLQDMKIIPLGMSYILPNIGKDMQKIFDTNKETLLDIFDVSDKADYVPHLCDFTSLMYGNWREFNEKAASTSKQAEPSRVRLCDYSDSEEEELPKYKESNTEVPKIPT
ncbi:MAG: hypothetical protein EBU66_19915, partial [Bacteroidetes bacterium]|nr:hypothetical protein [Bacteroidota bacterium]